MYQLYFDERELQMMVQILDAATRAGGLQAATPVALWQQKFVGAVQQAQAQQTIEFDPAKTDVVI